jgi:hypothetical protein
VTRSGILDFVRSHSLAVQASVSPGGAPQAALVGFIVTDDFEIVFDTLDTTRKVINLRSNASCAFVIGGMSNGDERTVQVEGIVDEPTGTDLERVKRIYFARFPDGRQREQSPGVTYLRLRPLWLRFSDFNQSPPAITEITF